MLFVYQCLLFTDVCLPMFVIFLMFFVRRYLLFFTDVVCRCLLFYYLLMIVFTDIVYWQREEDLTDLIMKVIQQGLEGLVLKDTKVCYIQYTLQLPMD